MTVVPVLVARPEHKIFEGTVHFGEAQTKSLAYPYEANNRERPREDGPSWAIDIALAFDSRDSSS